MKSIKVAKSKTPKTTTPKSERVTAPVKTSVIMPSAREIEIPEAAMKARRLISRAESKRATIPAAAPVITSEEIARHAYAIWERQGRPAGKATEHWLQAEMQLKTSQSFSE